LTKYFIWLSILAIKTVLSLLKNIEVFSDLNEAEKYPISAIATTKLFTLKLKF